MAALTVTPAHSLPPSQVQASSTNVDEEEVLADWEPMAPATSTSDKKGSSTSTTAVSSSSSSSGGTTEMIMSDVSFREMCLRPEILRAVTAAGFEHPSQVQASCLPQAVLGTDIICQSASGSGKTAVFVLAVLQQLTLPVTPGMTDTVVLANTREMAHQITLEFRRFSRYIDGFKCGEYYGGVPPSIHRNELKQKDTRPTVAVGTPGRMAQLVREGLLQINNSRRLILDECDQLLSTSVTMRADCQAVFKAMPRDKQVMMFSATMNNDTKKLIRKFVTSALEVIVSDERTLTLNRLHQYYVRVEEHGKNRMLTNLLDALEFNQVVIFVSNQKRASALVALLKESSFPAEAVHGGMKQSERLSVYDGVKNGSVRILVSTELFARGVDFERVNIVINYDMPSVASLLPSSSSSREQKSASTKSSPSSSSKITDSNRSSAIATCSETYLHRVGRSGRFGTRGMAISFISSVDDVQVLESVQSRYEVEVAILPDTIDVSTYM